MTERETTGIDLMLAEPEIVAWLEPAETAEAAPYESAFDLSAADR